MRIITTVVVAIASMSTVLLQAQPVQSLSDTALEGAAQSPIASPANSPVRAPLRTPRFELLLGYSNVRAVPELANRNRLVDLYGGSASLALNLNRYFSLVADLGGYSDTRLRLAGPGANPPSVADSAGAAFSYLFGPRLSFCNHSRVTPFVPALLGAAQAGKVTLSNCTGSSCAPLPAQTAFALTGGVGLDMRLARHISLRVVQAEYLMIRFPDPATCAGNIQNDMRLSTGLLFRLGGHLAVEQKMRPPATVACSADRTPVAAGKPVHLTASNRRLDIPLTHTGQQSIRQFPCNAADSPALLNLEESWQTPQPALKQNVTSAPK